MIGRIRAVSSSLGSSAAKKFELKNYKNRMASSVAAVRSMWLW